MYAVQGRYLPQFSQPLQGWAIAPQPETFRDTLRIALLNDLLYDGAPEMLHQEIGS